VEVEVEMIKIKKRIKRIKKKKSKKIFHHPQKTRNAQLHNQ
jgi:hypothetical protein